MFFWRIRKQWYVFLGGIFLLCFFYSCSSSKSSTESESCSRTGRYRYSKMTDLSEAPGCMFPNGNQTEVELGFTNLVATENGFTFVAGEEGRWPITATCTDTETANVGVILTNKCIGTYTTSATSTADINSSIHIFEYNILWTCGGELSCLAKESWILEPE